jgi:hypothetical protein
MKRYLIISAFFSVMLFGTTSFAWECGSADGDSSCTVTGVRLVGEAGASYYFVDIELDNKDNSNTTCDFARFRVGHYNVTADSIRSIQAGALTALTSGLPVRFPQETYITDDDYKICYSNILAISR